MLPERPAGVPSSFFTPTATESGTPNPEAIGKADPKSRGVNAASVTSVLEESLFPEASVHDDGEWTWAKVERERQRGLRFARAFDGLTELRDGFDGGEGGILGVYSDFAGGY